MKTIIRYITPRVLSRIDTEFLCLIDGYQEDEIRLTVTSSRQGGLPRPLYTTHIHMGEPEILSYYIVVPDECGTSEQLIARLEHDGAFGRLSINGFSPVKTTSDGHFVEITPEYLQRLFDKVDEEEINPPEGCLGYEREVPLGYDSMFAGYVVLPGDEIRRVGPWTRYQIDPKHVRRFNSWVRRSMNVPDRVYKNPGENLITGDQSGRFRLVEVPVEDDMNLEKIVDSELDLVFAVMEAPSRNSHFKVDVANVGKEYPLWRFVEGLHKIAQTFLGPKQNLGDRVRDYLHSKNIPEEAIESNPDFWDYVGEINQGIAGTRNRVFPFHGKDGGRWALRIFNPSPTTQIRAKVQAAVDYYVAPHSEIIVPGMFPEPLEANGHYMTVQEWIPSEKQIPMPVRYWTHAFAHLSRDISRILADEGLSLPEVQLYSWEEQQERYREARHNFSGDFDSLRWRDARDYFTKSSYREPMQLDPRCGLGLETPNLVGADMPDTESIAFVHPSIPFARLFLGMDLPYHRWRGELQRFVEVKGINPLFDSLDQEVDELIRGMQYAPAMAVHNEVIGTSRRDGVTENIIYSNLSLVDALDRLDTYRQQARGNLNEAFG
jgi:hypothetical protein